MKHSVVNKEDYLLVVDDSEIKQGDWLYHFIHGIRLFNEQETKNFDSKTYSDKNWKKIIAHLPLNNSPILEGVDLLPPLEDDVEKLAMDKLISKWSHLYQFGYPKKPYPTNYENDLNIIMIGIYQAKEKYKYTEEDLKLMFEFGYRKNNLIETTYESALNFIQSLQQPKMPVGFELKCDCGECQANKQGVSLNADCKRRFKTTNSQGITQWVGEYIY